MMTAPAPTPAYQDDNVTKLQMVMQLSYHAVIHHQMTFDFSFYVPNCVSPGYPWYGAKGYAE